MKKILLIITFLLSTLTLFSQEKDVKSDVVVDKEHVNTINNISAYPNPFTSKTQINFTSAKSQNIDFSVKNMLGKMVYHEKVEAKEGFNSISYFRNNLTKGMYIYTLQTNEELISKRLVIK